MRTKSHSSAPVAVAILFHLFLLFVGNLSAEPLPLRIVTGNLSSGRFQKYDEGPGARIFQGLKPDIALIQEFRVGESSKSEINSFVHSVFGQTFDYYRQDAELPNGIISRFPIVTSGFWKDDTIKNRDFAWARIALPGGRNLLAVSLHLSATDEAKRRAQTLAIAKHCKTKLQAGDFLVIGGDLNTQTRGESCVRSFSPLVQIGPPFPADEAGNDNTNRGRRKPTDWLLVNAPLQALEIPNLVTAKKGLVFDSRVFSDLAKVPPVLVSDSDAEQMQHMAVLRDFVLP